MPGGRLKEYGAGKPDGEADKGLLRQNQGDDPMATPVATFLEGHLEADFASVVSSQKGASLAQKGGRGSPPEMPGGQLSGHHFSRNESKSRSPKRSAGSKTPSADEMIGTGRE